MPNIGLFDVLEHIDDDRLFVRRLQHHSTWRLPVSDCAFFDWLWSMSDDAMHYRRYTRRTLTDVLSGAFEVLYSTYVFQRLVPISMLLRALPHRLGLARPGRAGADEREHAVERRRLAGVLNWMLDHEATAIAVASRWPSDPVFVVARRHQ